MSVQVLREISAVRARKWSPSLILQHMGKNILEDSKDRLSERKTLYYPVSNRAAPTEEHLEGSLRILSSSIEKFVTARRYSWHSPLGKQINTIFQGPDPVSPTLAEVPEQRGTEQCLSPVVYTLVEQRRENCT